MEMPFGHFPTKTHVTLKLKKNPSLFTQIVVCHPLKFDKILMLTNFWTILCRFSSLKSAEILLELDPNLFVSDVGHLVS